MDFNILLECREIWVYGYGNIGRNAYNKLKSLLGQNVKGILVTRHSVRTQNTEIGSKKKIFEISKVNIDNAVVIIATNPIHHNDILNILKGTGYRQVLIYDSHMDDWLNNHITKKPLIETRFLGICVGQACNLRCRDCANFAPYAEKENMRYDVEDIKQDMISILPGFSKIDTLHIQGGEPFIYSDLDKLLIFIEQNYFDIIDRIQIATNGTIIPSQNILEILKRGHKKYIVRISNYKNTTLSIELMQLLNRLGIPCKKYDFAGRKGDWSHSGGLKYKVPEQEDVFLKTLRCAWNTCYTIENGLLGRCARSIPARSLQNIEINDSDYLDLRQEIPIERLGKYFMFIEPMDCCKHCKGSNGEPIEAAIQLEN